MLSIRAEAQTGSKLINEARIVLQESLEAREGHE
jgi:hypothetical protein